ILALRRAVAAGAVRETPHVRADGTERAHAHDRAPLEQIEGPRLVVRAAPSAVQLPRAVAHAREHHRADVLAPDARHEHVRAIAECLHPALEVLTRVERGSVAPA